MTTTTEPFDHAAASAAIDPKLAELIESTRRIGTILASAKAPIDGVDLHALPTDVSQRMRQRRRFLIAAESAYAQFSRSIDDARTKFVPGLDHACPICGKKSPLHQALCGACAQAIADA